MVKLDHNKIGNEGINILAHSLGSNPEIELLSLTYCDIGPEGGQALMEIIIYQQSKIQELSLTGNPLGEGIIPVF